MNKCEHKGWCHKIAKILIIIGGVNWGLIGLGLLFGSATDWNVVRMLLGGVPVVEAIVYVLVGAAAVAKIFGCRCCKCKDGVCGSHSSAETAPQGDANQTM